MCRECYVDDNRITPLLKPLECLEKIILNIFVVIVGAVYVLNMSQRKDYKDGIFHLSL